MPILAEELWKNPGHPGMIVVTAHASLDRNGRLVMEVGAALEAARRIPGITEQCGSLVRNQAVEGVYGFLPVRPPRPHERKIGFGLFQTQRSWNGSVDLELIQHSMASLRDFAATNPQVKIRMDFPGLEVADRMADEVAAILEPLPPQVTICHRGEVAPRTRPGLSGTKEVFELIRRWLQEGRFAFAVEYLMDNGFDRDTAEDQVAAVQRAMGEWSGSGRKAGAGSAQPFQSAGRARTRRNEENRQRSFLR